METSERGVTQKPSRHDPTRSSRRSNASFVAGDTLKGNVDSMRSPRGARASPTLGSVKEASQRRSDAPAPQVGARKASAVSNVI